MRPVGTPEALERRRRRAVELVKQGEEPALVARILGVGRSSIDTGLELDRQSSDASAAKPHPGPEPRLNDERVKELEGLLREGAKAHGWPDDLWSARRVAEMIRRHLGVAYHVEHARKLIRRRLNWSSQEPQERARQRDAEAIAH